VVARVLRASGRDTPVDGFSQPYISAVAYGSAFFGAAALVLAMLSAEFLRLRALGSTLAVWFGTPLLFYMYVAPPMSHCCSAFAVALFVYIWLHVRRRWSVRGCILLGASAALMAMVREQDLFFVTGPALDFGLSVLAHSQSVKSRAQSVVAALAAFALCFTPQAIAYLTLNGHVGPSKLVTRKMSWTAPHTLQVLVSSEHGLFVWTPLALLAIAGLVRMALSARAAALSGREQMESERPALTDLSRVAVWMLLMVAFQVYVAGSVESWTVAGGYGQRRFVALSALLVIGLAALLQGVRIGFARKALAVAMVLAVYWNVALIAEFATGLMDRQRLSPRQNAYDAFVTLPRHLPSLAYRYFFDRASFYQSKSALDAQ